MAAEDIYAHAEICTTGHVIEKSVSPDTPAPEGFCEKCGGRIISNCPHCQKPIKGVARASIVYSRPEFCPGCGKPYPWHKEPHIPVG